MHVVNTAMSLATFPFTDLDNGLIKGKADGDFTKVVTANGATAAVTVTVTEVSGQAGYYAASLTPNAVGDWTVVLVCTHQGETYRVPFSFTVLTPAQADPTAAIGLTAERAAKLDRLDAAVSTRAAGTDWTPARAANLDLLGGAPVVVSSPRLYAVRGSVLLIPTLSGHVELIEN